MILFLKALAILNLAYFALIAFLTWKTLNQKEEWKKKERFLRLSDSNYQTILEFNPEWCLPALSVRNSDDDHGGREMLLQIYWIFGKLYLHIPLKPWFAGEWGLSLTDVDSDGWQLTWIHLGKKGSGPSRDDRYIMINMPWTFDWYQTSYLVMNPDFKTLFWLDDTKGSSCRVDRFGKTFDSYDYKEVHPYLYIKKDGTAQHRYATIRQEKRLWRRRCLPFTNLFCLRNHTISIDFDREVGEITNPWKGGVLGCSFAMLPGETGLQALRRMEATKRFNR